MQSKLQNCSCAGVPVANAGIIHARRRLNRRVQVHSSSSTSSSSTTTTSSSSSSSSSFSSLSSGNTVLVDGLVVQPTYRSTPWEAEHQKAQQPKDKAQVMFVSESGICRGPLAAALFRHMVAASPLRDCIEVHAKASRDYCVGQQPHPAASAVAEAALGTPLAGTAAAAANGAGAAASACGAVQFEPAADIVASDLVLTMDKYTAADVLREVSSYDLINPGGYYSARVRVLGSFHPVLSQRASQADGQDIDDPLYGNFGGQREQEAVLFAAKLIHESCSNLLQQLEGLAAEHGLLGADSAAGAAGEGEDAAAASGAAGAKFREALVARVRQEGVISWMVPPMLQGGTTDLGGWV